MKIEIFKDSWRLEDIKNNPDKIYIFGDNNARIGKGGQAIIRNLPNTIGLRTKKGPSKKSAAFYKDSEFKQNSKKILDDILEIKKEALDGHTIVFSSGGYGTGLSLLKQKAPKTYEYLSLQLKEHFNFNNEIGKKCYKVPGHDDIINGIYINLDKENKDILQPINNSYFRPNFLDQGLNTVFDLIKMENKVAFTSSKKYEKDDVLIFTFRDKSNLICRVVGSYEMQSMLSGYKWYSFEGYDKSFNIAGPENFDKFQTHFQFICTIDDRGQMVFKNDIFGGSEPEIDKKKVKIVGKTIQIKNKDMSEISNKEIFDILKRIESKLEKNKIKNLFRRKTMDELLEKKGLNGEVSKVESPFSDNKYQIEFDGQIYYFNYKRGFFKNSIEIIMVLNK